jgi:hypothetical protein
MSNIGHNSGIIAPTDQEMLDDLKRRFPELETRYAEFVDALKEYPKDLNLADADRAAALQDLLGQIKKQKSIIAAHKKTEKGPWDKLVKVVTNLFSTADEKLDALMEEWAPVHQAYMDKLKAERVRKQEEEAQRQREKEEKGRKDAEEAEARAEAARAEEAAARQREEAARAAAEKAEREKKEAQERADAAAAEERRQADERKKRERAEKDRNEESLRAIKRHMKDANKLHETMAEAGDDAEQADIDQLDALIRPGGIISVLAGPIADSHLLDEEQKEEVSITKAKLTEMRTALHDRLDAKARRKRAAEEKKQREADEAAAEARRLQREEDDRKAAEARAAREKAEAEKVEAEEARKKAQEEAREARDDARGAVKDQKVAGRDVRAHEVTADRAANAADKIETYLEKATDAEIAGTLRGELGTKGSLTRRWTLKIVDENQLRDVCGPLGPTLTADALNGAAYRWMLARYKGWAGKERVLGADVGLPGVIFAYQQGNMISGA